MSESTINKAQRISIMKTYALVCKDRGWKSSDREFRLAKFGEIIGRPIASTDEIGRIDECTKLMKELKAMLGVDLQAAREADDLTINQARVLRNQILTEIIPCLEIYRGDKLPGDIADMMEDKNRWWKLDRPVRGMTLMDLDAQPIYRTNRSTGKQKYMGSQLSQMQWTLSRWLNQLRNEARDTIHQMKKKAGVKCTCASCVPRRPVKLILPPLEQDQLESADVPDENKPF